MARKRTAPQGPLEPEDYSQEVPDVEAMRNMPHPPPPKKRPIHVVSFGKIQAAIWENWASELGMTVYNVTVSRSYRDGDGQWQSSNSFGLGELLLLAKAVDYAHTWISEHIQNEGI
jgi:hypothetical protein